MPLYEYQCDACGNRFEAIQKFSDKPIEVCPRCGGNVRKLQSAPAIQFKGSGWYITDYARKDQATGEKKAEKSETVSTDSEKSSETAKTEPKTDKKTDKKTETVKSEGGSQKSDSKKP
jgi:putative FmdB family regulatory protein